MATARTLDQYVAMGKALSRMEDTLGVTKATATRSQQYAVRKAFRDAAAYLREAGYKKDQRDRIMKPFQLQYDPRHRTR